MTAVPPEALAAAIVGIAALLLVGVALKRRRAAHRVPRVSTLPKTAVDPGRGAAMQSPGRLKQSLADTRQRFLSRLQSVLLIQGDSGRRLQELEEVLLSADVGVRTTESLLKGLRTQVLDFESPVALRNGLREQMVAVLASEPWRELAGWKPHVILVAGVNGVGKTTTIGKLAHRYVSSGKKVLLVAADTFRAAASEQLQLWAQRVGADCVRHQRGADPSAVAYDGIAAALARNVDVVIVDTAGRLHVRQHLVEELRKIVRTIQRQLDGAPHDVFLVIDATTGQNALSQARVFQEALALTGIVLSKLDGTAKGGAVFAIRNELGVPIRYVGTGESMQDLEVFDSEAFVDALFGERVQ